MCQLKNICLALLLVFGALSALAYYKLTTRQPIPHFDRKQYWGAGKEPSENVDSSVRQFKIDVSDKEIQDLKQRLAKTRPFVPPLETVAQEYGMNTDLLREVVDYWKDKYNWTERQAYLNQFPQFKTNIQGLDVHFLHVKPKNPGNKRVLPLIIVHGWPGSVREFYDVIPIFTTPSPDRDFVFEVIVPAIPGFGFSQGASKPGLGASEIAVVFNNLMERLGFEKYYCQGGDFGAIILQSLTAIYPDNVLGFHTNMAVINTPLAYLKYFLGSFYSSWLVRPDHYDRIYPLYEKFVRRIRETGYLHLQSTKPDTIGVGVNDSPAGLAAYILEKFTTGTNIFWQARKDGGLLERFTYDKLIDNLMYYWLTNSATTSFRLYSESFNRKANGIGVLRQPLRVPTAIARFKYDFYVADGIINEIFPNNVQLSDFDGGHFAAFELPEIFANDVFRAVEKFRSFHSRKENPKGEL